MSSTFSSLGRRVCAVAIPAAIVTSALAVTPTCPPTSLWMSLPRGVPLNPWDVDAQGFPLPAEGQGQNGIRCQGWPDGGTTDDLAWLNYAAFYQTWGDIANQFLVPQIYAMPGGERVFAHPRNGVRTVIRMAIDGPAGTAVIRGSTGTDASTDIAFEIYTEGLASPPSWSGTVFEDFVLVFDHQPGTEVILVTRTLGSEVEDWAWWQGVELLPLLQADINGDGTVDGSDLGLLLGQWGPCGAVCTADLDCNGEVNGGDLGILLADWG